MKSENFLMRFMCLLLIIAAVIGYNFMKKNDAQAEEITELTERVAALETQQTEMLTALDEAAQAREEAEAAAAAAKEEQEAEAAAAAKEAEAAAAEESSEEDYVYKDGTYTGEAQGYGGTIQVSVTLASDTITDIQVVSAPNEDAEYLNLAVGVIDTILSTQSTDVDTVTGSTFSTTGIINAVIDALGKAENQ